MSIRKNGNQQDRNLQGHKPNDHNQDDGNKQNGSQQNSRQQNNTQQQGLHPNGTRPDADEDAKAVMAQLQMNDLGDANRHNITTVDPGFRPVNLRREYAIRECNDESSDAGKAFANNKLACAKWNNLGFTKRPSRDQKEAQDGEPIADGQSHRSKVRATVDAHKQDGDYDDLPPHISYGNPRQNEQYFQDRKKDFETFKAESNQSQTRSGNGNASRPAPSDRGRYTNRTMPRDSNYTINGAPRPTSPLRRGGGESAASVNALPQNKFTKGQMELAKSMANSRTKNLSNIPSSANRNGVKRPHQYSTDPPRYAKSTRTNGPGAGASRDVTNGQRDGSHGTLWSQAVDHTSRFREPGRASRNPLTHSAWSGQLVENPPVKSPPRAPAPVPAEVRRPTIASPATVRPPTVIQTAQHTVAAPSTRPAEVAAVIEARRPAIAAPPAQDERSVVAEAAPYNTRGPISAVQGRITNGTHERSISTSAEPNEVRPVEAAAHNTASVPRTPADLCTSEYLHASPYLAHLYTPDTSTNTSAPRQDLTSQSPQSAGTLLEVVDEREMGNLSTNFAALSLTPRPDVPATAQAGIMESTHATYPSPSQSTVSLGATTTTTNPVYLEAISSEDAFWKWKQGQQPNRPNRIGP